MAEFSYAVDCFFIVDICLTLFTSIEQQSGEEVVDLHTIRRAYVCSFCFISDIIAVFPFDLVIVRPTQSEASSGSQTSNIHTVKLLKLFRLLRLRKISSLRGFLKCFSLKFKLVLSLFYLFLYVHIAACLWSLMTESQSAWYPPKDVTVESTYFDTSRIGQRYVTALYYSTLMLLGADAFPKGELQMLFAAAVSLIGAVVIAILFGNMTILMNSLRFKSKQLNEEIDTANHVMAAFGIPTQLQTKALEYIQSTFRTKDQQRELNKFLLLLSPSLKFHLSQHLFGSALKQNKVFKGKATLAESLVRYVRIHGCNPEAVLMREGQTGKAAYILAIGEVSVSVRNVDGFERFVRKLQSGDFFGEIALLTTMRRTATVTALNFCTYGVLPYSSLLNLIGTFPSLHESLIQHILQEYSDDQRSLVIDRLSQLPFVSCLSESDRMLLFYSLQPGFYGKSQVIQTRGQSPTCLFVLVSGKLSVRVHLKRREVTGTLLNLSAGSLCFCASFLTGDPLVSDVVAAEPTVAFTLDRKALERNC